MRLFCAVMIAGAFIASAFPVHAQTSSIAPPLFSAPAGWAQIPRGFMLTEIKNVWQGPKVAGGRAGAFAEAVLPFPASLVSSLLNALTTRVKFPVAARGARNVCGNPGTASILRLGRGKNSALLENEIFSKAGLTYVAIYAHPANLKANPAIETTLRNFCPSANGDVPPVSMPAGWTALQNGIDLELSEMWLGNSPMQMILLAQGHSIPSPEMIAGLMPTRTVRKGTQVQYGVRTRRMKFCGRDGTLVNVRFGGGAPINFSMSYDLADVESGGVSYLLSYFHPSDFTDPGAEQSLQTLCAPSPAPSATPSPAPSTGS